VQYRRSPIEIESPEQLGYEKMACNLAESSVTDARLQDLSFQFGDLVLHYGDHMGKPELRDLIVSEAPELGQEDVLLTVGAAGALFIIATSLLSPGDHVVIAFPNYVTNLEVPRSIGCNADYLDLTFEEEFKLNADRLADRIRPNTHLVRLTNPHNPTGSVMSEAELQKVIELVEDRQCHLLFDETYREMTF
jgi:aspartate/methionine/tyrosine aminotransferase